MPLILLLAFASGALTFTYEVLWLRDLTVRFGATAPATAAVLAAVFSGLAAGSIMLGRRAFVARAPLKSCGWFLMATGLAAFAVPWLAARYEMLVPWLGAYAGSGAARVVLKTLVAFVAVFAPTFFLGGLLPALLHVRAASPALVYAAHVVGGAIGALLVPYFWLPTFGGGASATVLSASCAVLGALMVARRSPRTHQMAAHATRPFEGSPAVLVRAGVLAFLSGFLHVGVEVSWVRAFAQVHENSVYSFAAVVALFVIGLGIGGALVPLALRRGAAPRALLGIGWSAAGASVLVAPTLFVALTAGLSYLSDQVSGASPGVQLLAVGAVLLLPTTILAGLVVPLLLESCGPTLDARVAGRLLGLNTVGAIAGPLVTNFLLLPVIGLWGTLTAFGLAMVLCGVAAARTPITRAAIVMAGALLLVLGLRPLALPRVQIATGQGEHLLALSESSHGIVAVVEDAHGRRIKLNNCYTLGGTASARDSRQLGHIPLLLQPRARRACFVGLGTALTASAATVHPLESITLVEVVPDVVTAARSHFAEANLNVLDDPRVQIVMDEGRSYLRSMPRSFDVIVGDLVVPWRAGESSVYTREHFAAARAALTPGGVFCQWLPLFQLSRDQWRSIAAAFAAVFPMVSVWRGDFLPDLPALALLGCESGQQTFDADAIAQRIGALNPRLGELNPYLAHPCGLWLFCLGAFLPSSRWLADVEPNSDAHPIVELKGRTTPGTGHPLVGRELDALLHEIASVPASVGGLALSPLELTWTESGMGLWHASLLASEGQKEQAHDLAFATLDRLPIELRHALFGPKR